MARRRSPVQQWIVGNVCLLFAGLVSRLPLRLGRAVGHALAWMLYYALPRIRKVALGNLDLAYGETLSRREKVRIAKAAVRNAATVAVEFTRIPRLKGSYLEQHVHIEGVEHLDMSRGNLLIGAHLGNWEWMPAAVRHLGNPFAFVVRPLDSARLNAFVEKVRQSADVRVLAKDGSGPDMVRLLREGWWVGLLIDQSPRHNGVPVRMFGHPCWATAAPVMAALRAHAPVVPTTMIRRPDSGYTLAFHAPIEMIQSGDFHKDLVENTQRCQDSVERLIRAHPEQWLWLHRRWRERPALHRQWEARTGRSVRRIS